MYNLEQNIKNEYKFDKLIKTLMLICIGIIVSVTFHFEYLISILFAISFIILLTIIIRIVFTTVFRVSIAADFFIMLGMFMFSYMFVVISGGGLMSLTYMRKFYMFAATVIFVFIGGIVNVEKKTKTFILATGLVLSTFYIMVYLTGNAEYFGSAEYLSFGHSNSNLTGMWLLAILMLLVMCYIYFERKLLKMISIIEIVAISCFLVMTKARTSIIAACSFPIMYMIVKFIRCRLKFERQRKIFVFFIVLIPLLFASVYMIMIENHMISKDVNTILVEEGKVLTSRSIIWRQAIDAIKEHPFMGSYFDTGGYTGSFQLHNTALDTCVSYGIPIYVLFVILMTSFFSRALNNCKNKFELLLISAELTMFNTGIGEAGLLSGSLGMYIIACSFMLLIDKSPDID